MTEAQQRKDTPVFSGVLKYFPDALAAVARVSRIGNEQHNPGSELHWDRSKSADEYDACARHLLDRASGSEFDSDGQRHMAKVAWRALAALQKEIEAPKEVLVDLDNRHPQGRGVAVEKSDSQKNALPKLSGLKAKSCATTFLSRQVYTR